MRRAVLLLVLAAAAAGCNREPPEKKFQYDLLALQKTDPSTVLYDQTARIDLTLHGPSAIAAGADDAIHVGGSNALCVYSAAGVKLRELELAAPATCLAVDGNGDLYVGSGTHVTVLSSNGTAKANWSAQSDASIVTSIALTEKGVFVADAGERVVLRYERSGKLLGRIDGKSNGSRGFIIPSPYFDLAIGRDDSIWVVNPGVHTLQNYRYTGELITSWSKRSVSIEGFCGCCNPAHIALLADGSFVTAEKGLPRIKVYGPTGEFVGVVVGTETLGEGELDLDLAVDSAGRVLALDAKASAVRVFVRRP